MTTGIHPRVRSRSLCPRQQSRSFKRANRVNTLSLAQIVTLAIKANSSLELRLEKQIGAINLLIRRTLWGMADNKEAEGLAAAVEEEEAVVEQPPTAEDAKPADDKPAKEKKPKAPKEKRPRKPKAASHPPYFQMIKEALLALNEKSGSSPYAIAKYMEEKHKAVLPANFRKILALQLKNSAGRGKLIKIRASYKLSEVGKKEKSKAKAAKANAEKPAKQATTTTTTTTRASRTKTKSVNKPEAPKKTTKKVAASAKKAKKSAPAKPKQPKSIKSPAAKRAKKATATA